MLCIVIIDLRIEISGAGDISLLRRALITRVLRTPISAMKILVTYAPRVGTVKHNTFVRALYVCDESSIVMVKTADTYALSP